VAKLSICNEFGRNSTVMAIEPASQCIAHCTYCFAELNRRRQQSNKTRRFDDNGSFERIIERATGPNYDPTNFLEWAVVNRIPFTYANGVEPFQDIRQAIGILKTCESLDIPLFIQTKGVNFESAWDYLEPLYDNSCLFISMGSDDDRVIKRFEPSTPLSAERWRIIEKLCDNGFDVILALSPYHEEWHNDPASMIKRAADMGVEGVFYDRLHLNSKQAQTATDPKMVEFARQEWTPKAYSHLETIYSTCLENDLAFTMNRGKAIVQGVFPTRDTISSADSYERGQDWPYHDDAFYNAVELFYDEQETDDETPIVAYWDDILAWTERNIRHDQPFKTSILSELIPFRKLAPAWVKSLGEYAPIQEVLRAFYNSGQRGQFGWSHPFTRIAIKENGDPWRDQNGNLVCVYAPNSEPNKRGLMVVPDLKDLRVFEIVDDDEEDEDA